ncbi:MAG: hypothetical protein U1E66_09530 [Rhodospirillales bacterium]
MRTLVEFIKTTLIGGLLVVLPLYLSLLLLAKTVGGLLALIKPVASHLPVTIELRQFVAILLLAVICFVIGLIVRTAPGRRAKGAFERSVMTKIPGYTFVRDLIGRITGRADDPALAPALVELEEALVPALIVEQLDNGWYTVLVPSVPTPMAGALYILPGERVHPVDVSFTKAIGVFSKWGAGAGELVAAMHSPLPRDPQPPR